MSTRTLSVATARGPAQLRLRLPGASVHGLVVLLHGAGSGTGVPVLAGLAARLVSAGVAVAALEQPYRVAGRRAPDPAPRLDEALAAAVAALRRRRALRQAPLGLAGRSSGARVACRTAAGLGAAGVVALGFPLQPPAGRPSRQPELDGAGVPVLVVQGSRDSFGLPEPDPARRREVHVVAGADHVLAARRADARTTADCVAEAVTVAAGWLLARLDVPDGPEGEGLEPGAQRPT